MVSKQIKGAKKTCRGILEREIVWQGWIGVILVTYRITLNLKKPENNSLIT